MNASTLNLLRTLGVFTVEETYIATYDNDILINNGLGINFISKDDDTVLYITINRKGVGLIETIMFKINSDSTIYSDFYHVKYDDIDDFYIKNKLKMMMRLEIRNNLVSTRKPLVKPAFVNEENSKHLYYRLPLSDLSGIKITNQKIFINDLKLIVSYSTKLVLGAADGIDENGKVINFKLNITEEQVKAALNCDLKVHPYQILMYSEDSNNINYDNLTIDEYEKFRKINKRLFDKLYFIPYCRHDLFDINEEFELIPQSGPMDAHHVSISDMMYLDNQKLVVNKITRVVEGSADDIDNNGNLINYKPYITFKQALLVGNRFGLDPRRIKYTEENSTFNYESYPVIKGDDTDRLYMNEISKVMSEIDNELFGGDIDLN